MDVVADNGAREVEMLAKQIEFLMSTQAALKKHLEAAKAAADRTLIQVAEAEAGGKRSRRGHDDIDAEREAPRSMYRSLSSPHHDEFDEESMVDHYSGGAGGGLYRGVEDDSDEDDPTPRYRSASAVSIDVIPSSTGPADEFDGELALGDEPTYRGSGEQAIGTDAGTLAKKLDVDAVRQLASSLSDLVAQGSAADEKVILHQLQRVMEVLG